MRALLAVLAFSAILPAAAFAQEEVSVQRYLAHLTLGDSLKDVQKIYVPTQEWPSYIEPRGHVKRIKVERASVKSMPRPIDILWLGMKKGRLVEIQLVYEAEHTRKKSVEALAGDLALIYGEPKSADGKYWWSDGKTVIRVFTAEVPALIEGEKGVEFRTSLQLMEEGLFKRTD